MNRVPAMDWDIIEKDVRQNAVPPNLLDYERECAAFRWDAIRSELDGLPDGKGLNMAHEAVDRHAAGPKRHHAALRWLGKKYEQVDLTYEDLHRQSNRFANVLRSLEIEKGDVVFALTGRIPLLYVAAIGTLKNVCVFSPLFSAFGPEPIFQRLRKGRGRVLVTTRRLYEKSVAQLRPRLPELKYVLLTDAKADLSSDVLSLPTLLRQAPVPFNIPPTSPDDPALLHFTSGTTGMPKGALHVHKAVLMHYATGKYVLDFHADDVFWCTADPGWVTGTSYGILAPLTHGITNVVDESDFDAVRWYGLLESMRVSVWYTAPTAIRMLMRLNGERAHARDLSALRHVCSVGEPLNPEAVVWGKDALGIPIHDNWWQTETGGIVIANYRAMDLRPGSMGRPHPGIEAAVVRSADGHVEVLPPDTEGELALRVGWPSMFVAYVEEEERYRKCFAGDWYLTGDLARRDSEGYYWFVGRKDDIIKTAGHMVSPFEVESALMAHEAVAEAAVIGKPEPTIGELVKAFVTLKPGFEASEELKNELLGHGRSRLGSAVAPKEIAFEPHLPKTRSGKIMRRLLKARELGLPEGDLSTLEPESQGHMQQEAAEHLE